MFFVSSSTEKKLFSLSSQVDSKVAASIKTGHAKVAAFLIVRALFVLMNGYVNEFSPQGGPGSSGQ